MGCVQYQRLMESIDWDNTGLFTLDNPKLESSDDKEDDCKDEIDEKSPESDKASSKKELLLKRLKRMREKK